MSKTKHTPGPWRYWPCKDGSFNSLNDYMQIASGHDHVARVIISSTTEADMRLIAAAPELLEALQELSRYFVGEYGEDTRSDNEIDAGNEKAEQFAKHVIAKATGTNSAALIAAAPDLLNALIECEAILDEFDANSERTMRVRAAIAKATGSAK